MKKKRLHWVIALLFAISIHILIFGVAKQAHWFESAETPDSADFSLILLPNTTPAEPTHKQDVISNGLENEEPTDSLGKTDVYSTKPNLLDLSGITLESDKENEELQDIFSQELREKILAAREAQQEYLKGQVKETEYPITEGADGTRYVNIKGICWRIPAPNSNEPWAVVVAGCNNQTKSFQFNFNISPSMLLGEDSPLSSGQ